MTFSRLLAAAVFAAGVSSAARADIIVTVENAALPATGGLVDVFIRSDGGDTLGDFGVEFRLTSANGRRLEFQTVQPDPRADARYLFFGNSGGVGPFATVGTIDAPGDAYRGGDFSADPAGLTVPATDRLLTQLLVGPSIGAPPLAGDTFTVELVPSAFTAFDDPDFNPLAFSATPGTVSVTPDLVDVPAPASAVLLAVGGALALIARTARRRAPGHPG